MNEPVPHIKISFEYQHLTESYVIWPEDLAEAALVLAALKMVAESFQARYDRSEKELRHLGRQYEREQIRKERGEPR